MALKLDMGRAYDRMRWDFSKKVMEKFGFAEQFVELVISCICDHLFAVLVNGTPTTWFHSTMGLRQGDPLSPYMFIVGAEAPARMIKCEHEKGEFSGLSLGVGQGQLGHLMYADGYLLVARAYVEEAVVVCDMLKDYCCLSGQNVTFAKSQVIYGADVPIRHCRIIKMVLKMEEGFLVLLSSIWGY